MKKGASFYLEEELYKYAKKAAVDEDKTLSNLLEAVVKEWRAKRPATTEEKSTKKAPSARKTPSRAKS